MSRTKKLEKVSKEKQLKGYDSLEEIAGDADDYASLKAVADQRGGQLLVDTLIRNAVFTMDSLAANIGTLSHSEIVSMVTRFDERLQLARSLTRASDNLKAADEQLEEALRQ